MDRRNILKKAVLAAGAAVLGSPIAARAANNSRVTVLDPLSGNRRPIEVIDEDLVSVVVVVLQMGGDNIQVQSYARGCAFKYTITLRNTEYMAHTHHVLVVDCAGNACRWRIPAGGVPEPEPEREA